ncbi:MAG: arginine decarboxylase, pyruvoyl-dependent [candidate division WOR-3 bacterium]|nr:arginine decarboxylase, pyruvoyl-dependent [candidate division WOR-3 bacterium]
MEILPKYVFLTKGTGVHREKLASFEGALRDAGIAAFNLVRVSSIFPPHCRIISRVRGLKTLTPGQITFVVMSDNATCEPHRLVSASVGIAVPKDTSKYGYLSEYHSFGEREERAGDYAEDLAAQMLATTLGVQFNADTSYDQRKEIWKISSQIVHTQNITQSAIGHKNGLWTSVVAAAVLIDGG